MNYYLPDQELLFRGENLIVFRNLLNDPVFHAFLQVLKENLEGERGNLEGERGNLLYASYSKFLNLLYSHTTNFSSYLLEITLGDTNFYVQSKAGGQSPPAFLEIAVKKELETLQRISRIPSHQLQAFKRNHDYFPPYEIEELDFHDAFSRYISSIPNTGYGIFRKHHFFYYEDQNLLPVKYPDHQQLSQLMGYERQRNLIKKNTEALLEGKNAANILFYGDAGTGKSSTVKAIANEYREKGLRLVEINKQQLHLLPEIMDKIPSDHLFFIIFVDDLSFTKNDDNFSMLKAILEGGATAVKKNVVIYATTNRRHLVKESVRDSSAEELFLNDSIQETMSLSARFGLFVTYERPDKDSYLEIVRYLAREENLSLPKGELEKKAEAHAILCGGRSPRAARQFIDLLVNDIEL